MRKRNSGETAVGGDLGDRNHCRVCAGGEMNARMIQPAESTDACFRRITSGRVLRNKCQGQG